MQTTHTDIDTFSGVHVSKLAVEAAHFGLLWNRTEGEQHQQRDLQFCRQRQMGLAFRVMAWEA